MPRRPFVVRSLSPEELEARARVSQADVVAADRAWSLDARPDTRTLLRAGEAPPPAES